MQEGEFTMIINQIVGGKSGGNLTLADARGENSLTFSCESTPTEMLSVNIVIL